LVGVETVWQRLLLALALAGMWRLPGPLRGFRTAALLAGAVSLLSPHAWPAVLALLAAARSLGRPGAADTVADLVLAAARREPWPDPASVERRSQGVVA
jgi:hypothetical protein